MATTTHNPVRVNGTPRRPRLTSIAHEHATLPALRLVESSCAARRIAKVLVACLVLTTIGMLFLPWQQSVSGRGQVVAYAPAQRQQVVEAFVSGRVLELDDSLVEGAWVQRGQKVMEIHDNDRDLLRRLREQRDSAQLKLEASEAMAEAYRKNLDSATEVRTQAVRAAEQQVEMAVQKVLAEQSKVRQARADQRQAELNYDRQRRLESQGLASRAVYEEWERRREATQAKVKEAEAELEAAHRFEESMRANLIARTREADMLVERVRAELRKIEGEVESARIDLTDKESKIARQETQVVTAPRDGFIFRMMINSEGQQVKVGDPLFVLVPDTADRAVEIWVRGNDAPLIQPPDPEAGTPGSHVRLQFEGWPAVQFAGWPSVAVGTFGGRVAVVDATDNGDGEFRVLIVPDKDDQAWPKDAILRQGVRANGWVLLDQVSLGYEMWRRLNGFPPVVAMKEPKPAEGFKKGK